MKATGLKLLYMEAEEVARNITHLKEKEKILVTTQQYTRNAANISALERKFKGLIKRAEQYGKDDSVFAVALVIGTGESMQEHSLFYSNVDAEEVDLLLDRDLKGLEYKVLEVKELKTGKIYQ